MGIQTESMSSMSGDFRKHAVIYASLYIIAMYSLFLWLDVTHEISRKMLAENNVVELATFVVFIAATVYGVRLWMAARRTGALGYELLFFAAFTAGMFFIAMEEIAWGQWFFRFDTPDAVAAFNAQGELTLHNHELVQDYLEALPLLFGLGGLIGIFLARFKPFSRIAPPISLAIWFVVILGFSAVDLIHEFYIFSDRLFDYVNHLDELVELLVSIACVLYLRIRYLEFAGQSPAAAQ